MNSELIRIILADAHPFFRDGFKSALKKQSHICLLAEAEANPELIKLTAKLKPDILIIDYSNRHQFTELSRELKRDHPKLKVIAFALYNDPECVKEVFSLGCNGYVLKNANRDEIFKAIKSVHTNDYYFSNTTTDTMVNLIVESHRRKFKIQISFSKRELEIIQFICAEYTTKEIALKLGISTRTIDCHRDKIQKKIGAKGMAGIIKYALKNNVYCD
jgi:DNA-binding NarL/FixJ family response regulator